MDEERYSGIDVRPRRKPQPPRPRGTCGAGPAGLAPGAATLDVRPHPVRLLGAKLPGPGADVVFDGVGYRVTYCGRRRCRVWGFFGESPADRIGSTSLNRSAEPR